MRRSQKTRESVGGLAAQEKDEGAITSRAQGLYVADSLVRAGYDPNPGPMPSHQCYLQWPSRFPLPLYVCYRVLLSASPNPRWALATLIDIFHKVESSGECSEDLIRARGECHSALAWDEREKAEKAYRDLTN